jgi:hypothetical protein
MSRFLLIAGVILALLGLAMGIQHFSSPETMQVRGLTFDSAITMITGGLLAMGLGSLLERLAEVTSFGIARAADEEMSVEAPVVAVAPKAEARSIAVEDTYEPKADKIDDSAELPALRRFGTTPIPMPPRAAPINLPDPIAKPSIPVVEAPAVEIAEDVAPATARFRLPGFARRTEVPAAPEPIITAPPPVPAPVRSAADEAMARVPAGVTVTTRKITSQREAASHLIPAVTVRTVGGPAATAAATSIAAGAAAASGISSTGATGKSVAETLDALEQAKTEIRQAFERTPDRAPVVEEDENMPGPEDEFEDDADDVEGRDGELYVVEEMNVRGRPARLLSDGTVEAETEEGWMRFENTEHLNEYLDAA